MSIPEQAINDKQLREIGKHCFCKIGIDEYRDSMGEVMLCVECETCGKILASFKLREPEPNLKN